jgi:uracil-DNA glycosylase
MSWTPRQQAMLQAMGLRVWLPEALAPTPPSPASVSASSEPVRAEPVVAPPIAAAARPAAPLKPAPAAQVVINDPARATHIATLDWPALREAVASCQACGLSQGRTQTVFGVGHQEAHWMVVGEAPGEQEDLSGEPFVGAAGQLLDNMLRALSLTRSSEGDMPASQRVFIANTLKCRPPRNRNPSGEEMAACEPFLKRQLALVRPRIILAMGRFAVQMLLNTQEPIGRLRGRVHAYQGVPLVVTYHPAYLLRTPADKARAWDDLCLAAQVAEGQAVKA